LKRNLFERFMTDLTLRGIPTNTGTGTDTSS
jgi:hypothetical protein